MFKMEETVTVSGFTVIMVKLKENKVASEVNWWLKKGSTGRAINVTGIPLFAREECVRRVFAACGNITSITLQSEDEECKQSHLPKFHQTIGYQQATVTFKKKEAVQKALTMKYDNNYTLYDVKDKVAPMTKVWKKDLQDSYNINSGDLSAQCTNYMKMYDAKKEEEEKANRKLADEPDDEGWITVTRNKFSHPPKAVKAHELKKLKKKKEASALLHFYKNQINDSKMQRIRELKAKFEEDKKKIQEMRQQRKFKPY